MISSNSNVLIDNQSRDGFQFSSDWYFVNSHSFNIDFEKLCKTAVFEHSMKTTQLH